MPLSKPSITIAVCLLCIACGDQAPGSKQESSKQESSKQESSKQESSMQANSNVTATNKTPTATSFTIDPQGFVNTADPRSNRIALLIEIGKIRAKVDAYHTSRSLFTRDTTPEQTANWQSMLTRSINQTSIDDYAAIEPSLRAPEAIEITTRLGELASPESLERASDNSRENRDGIRKEYEKARGVEERLRAVSDDIYPTRKEYFLVASALLRLGGDHAAKALDANGTVIDLYQLLLAAAYNHITDKSHPRWIAYCDGQRAPLEKLDERLSFISAKAAANTLGSVLEVNANDFYQLAGSAQAIANSLPDTDKAICE